MVYLINYSRRVLKMSRIFLALLALIVLAVSVGAQGQLQAQNATQYMPQNTQYVQQNIAPAVATLPGPAVSPAPSILNPPVSYYTLCNYNPMGQRVCYNYSYFNLGNFYPWPSLLSNYSASNNLRWGGYGYYPYLGYPGFLGYGYPGYLGYGYPGYMGYGYPGYLGGYGYMGYGYPGYTGYGYPGF